MSFFAPLPRLEIAVDFRRILLQIKRLISQVLTIFIITFLFAASGYGTLFAIQIEKKIQPLDSAAGAKWQVTPGHALPLKPGKKKKLKPAMQWAPVTVPGELMAQGVKTEQKKYSYRLGFMVDKIPPFALGLRLGEISDSDKTYLNGELIGATGSFDSSEPRAYDKIRVYSIPQGVLKKGRNVLLVQGQSYFDWEAGLYRGRVELGPLRELLSVFNAENMFQVNVLMIYLSVGAYFLFLFVRRSQDKENLFFALFALALVIYHYLRTQYKYDTGLDFVTLKQFQYLNLFSIFPFFYLFILQYYKSESRSKAWHIVMYTIISIYTIIAFSLLAFDIQTWEKINRTIMQPAWLVFILASLVILVLEIKKKDFDALIMALAIIGVVVSGVLDVLSSQAILNLPTLTTYTFIVFVLGLALILANRFVRVHNQVHTLNLDLSKTNAAYARFVPREFLSFLGRESIVDVEIGDQIAKEMTILFSDIRSFTTLSETMSPEENFNFLNSYLKHMTPIVKNRHGFIDKYIGDAIMALFDRGPEDAIVAAIDMQRDINHYNQSRIERNFQPISVGIGLHTGNLMLGMIGAAERMDGTVISDAVNLAARIEGITKMFGAAIAASGNTCSRVEGFESRYNNRFLGRMQVKGKTDSIEIFEIFDGLPQTAFNKKLESKEQFDAAMAFYEARDFAAAAEKFGAVAASNPEDQAALLYQSRAAQYARDGVPPGWTAIEKLENK